MDELLDKFLKDEVTPEAFEEGFSKLSEDDKTKALANPDLTKKIAGANTQALEALKGVRAAAKKIQEGSKPDLAQNLRKENVTKASKRFFERYKIPTEQQVAYLEDLEKSDSETVSEDLIFGALGRVYAARNSDELLSGKEALEKMREDGEQFNADHAGAPGPGDYNPEGKARDPKVLEWMRDAAAKGVPFASYEAAEKALSSGTQRTIG